MKNFDITCPSTKPGSKPPARIPISPVLEIVDIEVEIPPVAYRISCDASKANAFGENGSELANTEP